MTTPDQKLRDGTGPIAATPIPGIAIRLHPADATGLTRFTLIHQQSGSPLNGLTTERCSEHIEQALEVLAGGEVDWTLPADQAVPADGGLELYEKLKALGICFDSWSGRRRPCPGEPGYLAEVGALAEGASA